MPHDITKIFPEIELDKNGNPFANKKNTPPGFAYIMQPVLKRSWLETDVLKDIQGWTNNLIKNIYTFENEWLRGNLFKAGIPLDANVKTRCKIVKQDKAHIWNTTLYIDNNIASILSIDSITMEATIENADGSISNSEIY